MRPSIARAALLVLLLVVAGAHAARRPARIGGARAAADTAPLDADLAGASTPSPFTSHHGRPHPSWPPLATSRPLIGILSQPGDPAGAGESYIAASYVKFAEAGGARVVPFLHDMPEEEVSGSKLKGGGGGGGMCILGEGKAWPCAL